MTGTSAISSAAVEAARCAPTDSRSAVARARAKLQLHADRWRDRPLVRDIYRGYHETIAAARSAVEGRDLEVGAGHGSYAEFASGTVSCDIVPCRGIDCAADATRLPFQDGSLSNIVMLDVLHHVADPTAFFHEATRTLACGGRILFIEPYVSPVSWFAWRYVCEEPIDTKVRLLAAGRRALRVRADDPWDANVAIPTLLFWRECKAFQEFFPELAIIRRQRFDMFLYPLSGGFEKRRLVPMALVPMVRTLERMLAPLAPFLAFRCFVVIERSGRQHIP